MKIGFVGLGKLGLPVAVAIQESGHDVIGTDVDSAVMSKQPRPYMESGSPFNAHGPRGFNEVLRNSLIRFGTLREVCDHVEVLFVAVQTPHGAEYEGVTPMPETREDFDYGFLEGACREIGAMLVGKDGWTTVVVMSTVLPGTMTREVAPIFHDPSLKVNLVYNPSFIAMGQTMVDFLSPEFVLMGAPGPVTSNLLVLYRDLVTRAPEGAPKHPDFKVTPKIITMDSYESAELTKVAYNTFVSQKVAFANTLMEVCEKIPGADCDDVIDALTYATRRVLSPAYMRGGMGDGGACHPRDNIAMSWLARKLDLSHDLFGSIMQCRTNQSLWLANMVAQASKEQDLPIAILGYAYKPGVALTDGSAARLLHHQLTKGLGLMVMMADPIVNPGSELKLAKIRSVILIGCPHREVLDFIPAIGSYIIDPWGKFPRGSNEGIIGPRWQVKHIGREDRG